MAQNIVVLNARMMLIQGNITIPYIIQHYIYNIIYNIYNIIYNDMKCKNFRYHSTICLQSREKDESHPLVQLNETWKRMHYPPESATVMLLIKMIALVNQADNKEEMLSTFSQFCHRTVNDTHEIAHKLLGEKFIGQIEVLRQMMQKAINIEFTEHVCSVNIIQNMLYYKINLEF